MTYAQELNCRMKMRTFACLAELTLCLVLMLTSGEEAIDAFMLASIGVGIMWLPTIITFLIFEELRCRIIAKTLPEFSDTELNAFFSGPLKRRWRQFCSLPRSKQCFFISSVVYYVAIITLFLFGPARFMAPVAIIRYIGEFCFVLTMSSRLSYEYFKARREQHKTAI